MKNNNFKFRIRKASWIKSGEGVIRFGESLWLYDFIQILSTDYCSVHSDCQSSDANQECSHGECVCKSGYYADVSGICVPSKSLIDV